MQMNAILFHAVVPYKLFYIMKKGGEASYSYTVEVISIQPWPTFHSLLDLRDTENQ